ncbi:MAG: hypothetical protein H0T47_09615 [Planctomycetaceae bacterium]|nr:hypothetical protein [Planctomycetaceae bacterium]
MSDQTRQNTAQNHGVPAAVSPVQAAFLAAYEASGQVTSASVAAEVDRSAHYRWLKDEPAYVAAFERSEAIAAGGLKDEARRRAVEGLRRYKFTKSGDPILHPITKEPYFEDARSDTLLLAELKAKFPDEYRERSSIDMTANLNLTSLSEEETADLERRLGLPVGPIDSSDLEGEA